jgi:hypothetical protein
VLDVCNGVNWHLEESGRHGLRDGERTAGSRHVQRHVEPFLHEVQGNTAVGGFAGFISHTRKKKKFSRVTLPLLHAKIRLAV